MKYCKRFLILAGILNISATLALKAGDIHEAAKSGNLEKVKQLVTHQPGVIHALDDDSDTPLHLAAAYGHLEVTQYLIGKGSRVNAIDIWGSNPVFDASANGHLDVVKFLIEKGAAHSHIFRFLPARQ